MTTSKTIESLSAGLESNYRRIIKSKPTPPSTRLPATHFKSPGRSWIYVSFPPIEQLPMREIDMLAFCGSIAEQDIDESTFWSIVAWFSNVDIEALRVAALSDGYSLESVDFKDVKPNATQIAWALKNFSSATKPIALHVMCSVFTTLLGKTITDNNLKYVVTRVIRMADIVGESGKIKSDWVSVGFTPANLKKVTKLMNSVPHIRASLFNAFKEKRARDDFLPQLTSHVLELLNGSYMTSQIMIMTQLWSRAEIVALFTPLRFEMQAYLNWLNGLSDDDKKEIGYLRLKYGIDRTHAVSLRNLPLCSYVAYGLAKNTTSTLDNYSAFSDLDERKILIGDCIVEWILRLEKVCASQANYEKKLGLSPEIQQTFTKAMNAVLLPGAVADLDVEEQDV
ncbi:MAG: hypothetical protein [brine shrimp arlivirus 3]|nr:MAG: hypothetical protein [brine shrimp arlivirus 3]